MTRALDRGRAGTGLAPAATPQPSNLADVLERVLDKGVVIAGDIRIDLLDIELLTIKLRLLIASVDKAREMGIDWWEQDPTLSSRAARSEERRIDAEMRGVNDRLDHLERLLTPGSGGGDGAEPPAERPAARPDPGGDAPEATTGDER